LVRDDRLTAGHKTKGHTPRKDVARKVILSSLAAFSIPLQFLGEGTCLGDDLMISRSLSDDHFLFRHFCKSEIDYCSTPSDNLIGL
jgi:hypothetical protein